jgi:hypothetical protein
VVLMGELEDDVGSSAYVRLELDREAVVGEPVLCPVIHDNHGFSPSWFARLSVYFSGRVFWGISPPTMDLFEGSWSLCGVLRWVGSMVKGDRSGALGPVYSPRCGLWGQRRN